MNAHEDEVQTQCDPGYRLLAARPAFADESRASWIQRLASAHYYSPRRLSEFTGVVPEAGDWDRNIDPARWAQLLRAAEQPEQTCAQGINTFSALLRVFSAKEILLHDEDKPATRWCPKCLESDPVPYLRWEWRLIPVRHCPVHQVELWEHCPNCDASLPLHEALLSGNRRAQYVVDLSQCHVCGTSRCKATRKSPIMHAGNTPDEAVFRDQIRFVVDHAHLGDDDLKVRLHACWQNSRLWRGVGFVGECPALNPQDWSRLQVARYRVLPGETLRIDGSTFNREDWSGLKNRKRRTWKTWLLPFERRRLANALMIIRQELQQDRRRLAAVVAQEEQEAKPDD